MEVVENAGLVQSTNQTFNVMQSTGPGDVPGSTTRFTPTIKRRMRSDAFFFFSKTVATKFHAPRLDGAVVPAKWNGN